MVIIIILVIVLVFAFSLWRAFRSFFISGGNESRSE